MPRYGRPPRNGGNMFMSVVGLIFVLIVIGSLLGALLPLIAIAGVGYGVYYLATRQIRLDKANTAQRLQSLKDKIRQADHQTKVLDQYLDDKDYANYTLLARQLLPQIRGIQNEASALREKMDDKIYKRVVAKASEVEEEIGWQLEKLDIAPSVTPTGSAEADVLKRAPELTKVYTNIQRDHATILEKIETADNKAELQALHEADMERFEDILEGYLKIKESPKDFYNAEERLADAKAALEKFDKALDETLRKLNESDMKDFDISLRMMKDDDTNL